MSTRQTPAHDAGVLSCLQQQTRRHLEGRHPDLVIVASSSEKTPEDTLDPQTLATLESQQAHILICRREDLEEALSAHGIETPADLEDLPSEGLAIIERGHTVTVAAIREEGC